MLGLGLSLWSVALGASWTPAALFGAGQAGHWAEYNPALGLLFQDAAGTIPATLPDQPVGLAKRLTGSVDASQATALSRPTLARHPKGGRTNVASSSRDLSRWLQASGAVSVGDVVTASTANQAANIRVNVSVTELVITADVSALTPEAVSGEFVCIGAFAEGGAFVRAQVNIVTGVATTTGNAQVVENIDLGSGERRITVRCFGNAYTSAALVAGQYNNNFPAGRSFRFRGACINIGGVKLPFQDVVSANDITEAGKPDIWHLWNDGGDSLNAAPLPAGTYGLAHVDVLGGVTITTIASDGTTPINLLRAERQAQVILRQGAFTAAEEAQIRSYWGGLYV
ncbi:hypothetical protein M3484_20765 [Pseudomonas sp. GX19020]|uniref:hypothetical protein n=1 Tax=Pseudomonas sp. GX19020 TaxID=2942277 RepID=UPI0020191DEE|nr:hypothetical protein [Pseudomonas sp. GX19020]MCL4068993.1 hypothetical protein [Pseudomonas sp. GX19020]